MIAYLLKSACCLAFLLAFYHLVLEREKMHQFNRFYLLGSVLFSFLAPLFIIYTQIPTPEVVEIPLTASEPVFITVEETTQDSTINYWNIALGISAIISLLLSIRFGINLFKIFKKVRTNTKLKVEKAILVLVEDAISPHTFWNYIFINKDEYHSHKIEDELFTHELTHVTQKHTFDVLLIEVLKIVFWFNPLFYFLKKSIQLNHEFIADEKVINSFKNISEYQYLLLNKAAWNNDYYLASNLNYSLTKKRLVMMTTKTSRVNNWLKKIAVIPLLLGSIYVFAERVETYEKENEKDFIDSTIDKNSFQGEAATTSSTTLKDIKNKLNDINGLKKSIVTKENSTFIASVERSDNTVKLACHNCKKWSKLSVPLNKEFIITDWGFTNKKNVAKGTYAFTIKATENNIEFKGLKNTIWKNLTVSLINEKKQFLNQNGLLDYERNNLEETLKKYAAIEPPLLSIDAKNNQYFLNNRLIDINNIKEEFLKETRGEKSNLGIFTEGKVLMSLIKSIQQKLTKTNLGEIALLNSRSYIYDDTKVSKKQSVKNAVSLDSIPKGQRVRFHKNGYITYTSKDGKVITKKISELTEEEKKMIPPPPAPKTKGTKRVKVAEPVEVEVIEVPNKTQKKAKAPKPVKKTRKAKTTQVKSPEKPEKGWHYVNNQTLYFIKDKNGTKYFNRWGQLVTKEGKVIKQTQSNNATPNQNSSNASKNKEVAGEFRRVYLPPPPPKAGFPKVKKGDVTNIPPPPRRIRPEEYVKKHKKATFYFNNKKVSYKKALKLVKKEKLLQISTQEEKGKKVIKFVTENPVNKGWVYKNKQKPSNNKDLNLFQNSNENISYYLDEKKISKVALEKMNSDDIASISVKRNKDNSKSIYLISKK